MSEQPLLAGAASLMRVVSRRIFLVAMNDSASAAGGSGDPHEILHNALAGEFELEDELGRGGMGTVYLARDLARDRRVAIKVIHPELVKGTGLKRFQREIEITSRLRHPNIVPLLDSGMAGELAYFVAPFVEGESLRQLIRRRGKLEVDEAVRIAGHVAQALEYAHGEGVVHRDIKPENIIISEGRAIVTDFGIARSMDADQTTLTAVGVVMGSLYYISPEQLVGSRDVDARADLYSLGCVLYEMITGRPPFLGEREAIIKQHMFEKPQPLAGSVPAPLRETVMNSLQKRPGERQKSAAELLSALSSAPSEARARRHDLTLRLLAVAAALALIAALAIWGTCTG
jgi:serine/threonine protein kinase